jgi:iron(III) transport system permease protein
VSSVLPLAALALVALQPFWSPVIDLSRLSFDNFTKLFAETSLGRQAIVNSVMLSLIGATVGIVLVTVVTVYARERAGGSAWIVDSATKLPAGIPHVVLGIAFILTFTVPPFNLYGSVLLILLAYIVLYLPQASIAAGTAYDQVGGAVIEASRVSGADRTRTLLRVTAPLMRPGLIAGWTLLFVLMVGELNVSVILAAPGNPVVGSIFLNIWENGTFSQLAALGTTISLVSATFVTLVLLRSRAAAGALGSGTGR